MKTQNRLTAFFMAFPLICIVNVFVTSAFAQGTDGSLFLSTSTGETTVLIEEPAQTVVANVYGDTTKVKDKPSSYANLGARKLGDTLKTAAGEKKVWPHALPIWGQKVTDLGFTLPNPYGVTIMGAYIRQDLTLNNLAISTDGENFQGIPFVEFPGVTAKDIALQVKVDAWLFPFMNIYAVGGYIDGTANLTVGLPIDSVLSFFGLDHICGGHLEPDFCGDDIALPIEPVYHGFNVGLGTVLAMGFSGWFVTVPLTYVWSDLNITESTIKTFTMEILFGRIFPLGNGKALEFFVGTQYLNAAYKVRGSIPIPLSSIDSTLTDQTLYYELDEANLDRWNFAAGGNWQISPDWDLQFQATFLGSREQFVLGVVYRW